MISTIKSGFLLICKPQRKTSFGCIIHLKKILGKKVKIGHAGTLDPFACGLLLVAIGRQATAMLSCFSRMSKTYKATAKLGELTDTLDSTGTLVQRQDTIVLKADIEQALFKPGSSYKQTPPLYSALKYAGQPLYKLVRYKKVSAEQLELVVFTKRRAVTVHDIQLLSYEHPYFEIITTVSHGTYIRSFMNDIAQSAGTCATTHALERISIGPFSVEQSLQLHQVNSIEDIEEHLITIDKMATFFKK